MEWQLAQDDAVLVMAEATQKHKDITLWGNGVPDVPLVGVPRDELEYRVREAVRRFHEVGGESYVGSTSCPMWRWEGGASWRSEDGRGGPAARPEHMRGIATRTSG